MECVWFKRDLRVDDHRPLAEAARRGRVLALYAYEPDVLAAPETDACHVRFVSQSLRELREALRRRGGELVVRRGPMPQVLDELHQRHRFERLWSHEETGLGVTYDRDRRVKRWCRERGVAWEERPQTGVFRALDRRDGWSRRWAERMSEPLTAPPERIEPAPEPDPGAIPEPEELGLGPSERRAAQPGGEAAAHETLESFLAGRGADYRRAMSSPVEGWDACSRLSPYLAYGNVSLRRVLRETARHYERVLELRRRGRLDGRDPGRDPRWPDSLASFEKRLRWHCHFIQKLESEPEIEFRNMSRAYDGLRSEDPDAWTARERAGFQAFEAGSTGFPMVDASMRCLAETGWVNFRMRAMLVSFASHDLWLHWRPVAQVLARRFLDFEPGIHFPQCQMQSGTTGINSVRIYSPAKQVSDQDPQGVFVRRWVPELAGVPDAFLAEPHRMTQAEQERAGCRIGKDYPAPIVDHAAAVRRAKQRIGEVRRRAEARSEASRVFQKHGSRKPPERRRSG